MNLINHRVGSGNRCDLRARSLALSNVEVARASSGRHHPSPPADRWWIRRRELPPPCLSVLRAAALCMAWREAWHWDGSGAHGPRPSGDLFEVFLARLLSAHLARNAGTHQWLLEKLDWCWKIDVVWREWQGNVDLHCSRISKLSESLNQLKCLWYKYHCLTICITWFSGILDSDCAFSGQMFPNVRHSQWRRYLSVRLSG